MIFNKDYNIKWFYDKKLMSETNSANVFDVFLVRLGKKEKKRQPECISALITETFNQMWNFD